MDRPLSYLSSGREDRVLSPTTRVLSTVVRHGLTKEAVYRDHNGAEHRCSAVCPHLGCIVHWNNLEKVWDCPCHGSRFDAYDHVINRLAISDLRPLDTMEHTPEPVLERSL